jgi:tetracycline resistance efflux pump
MLPNWIVILPPLLVVVCVLLTKRMIPSFIVGIISAALIAKEGNLFQALLLTCNKLWVSTGLDKLTSIESFFSSWNLLIFLFLISMGMLIALLTQTGAAQAYATLVQKKVHTKKGVEQASLILSLVFFIDDYFSALTVGSVMRPLAQLYKVHPVKLAFLTTAMATPITLISPISSWVGEIILQLKQVGIGPASSTTVVAIDPYMLFLQSIPALFYAIIMIASAWYIVVRRISYGPMIHYEREALSFSPQPLMATNASFFDFLFPLVLLIISTLLTLLYTGNWALFGGTATIAGALKAGSVHQALFTGGMCSLLISTLYFYFKGAVSLPDIKHCAWQGFNLMFPWVIFSKMIFKREVTWQRPFLRLSRLNSFPSSAFYLQD